MTLGILSDRIYRLLKRGDIQRDAEFDMRDIQYWIRDSAAKLILGQWKSNRDENKNIDTRYVSTFPVAVQKDAQGNNYINIPVDNWINLPDGSGIQSVRPDPANLATNRTKNSEMLAFIPIPNRYLDIFYSLPASALENKFGWMIRNKQIFFTKKQDRTLLDWGIKGVLTEIVTLDPLAVGENDPFPISEDLIDPLIRDVLAIFTGTETMPKDLTNNQNPNI